MKSAKAAAPKEKPRPAGKSADEMGKQQREISVSEFFTKNRHLLGQLGMKGVRDRRLAPRLVGHP